MTWSTGILFSNTPIPGAGCIQYQESHPYSAMYIDSVKINVQLLCQWFDSNHNNIIVVVITGLWLKQGPPANSHLNRIDLNLQATTTSPPPHLSIGQICKNWLLWEPRLSHFSSRTGIWVDLKSEIYSFNLYSLCTIMRKSVSYTGEQYRFKHVWDVEVNHLGRFIVWKL